MYYCYLNKYCSRRTFVKLLSLGGFSLLSAGSLSFISSCISKPPENGSTTPTITQTDSVYLPTEGGSIVPEITAIGRQPNTIGSINISGISEFSFNPVDLETIRSDIFQPGHFSIFDVLVHLSKRGDLTLQYHFDDSLATHVIDSINNEEHWWYAVHYSGGWRENIAFRMDTHPYKDNSYIEFFRESSEHLEGIYATFRDEVDRLRTNGGKIIIPEFTIQSPDEQWSFNDVEVTPHNVRQDVLQPGVVTALDALLSMLEQDKLSQLKLTWYQSIRTADPVDSYWVENIDISQEAMGGCGFVYETGAKIFSGFRGSHIHIPSDIRVTVSPEYAYWFWICL